MTLSVLIPKTLTAICRLIRPVAAIVLCVALPPERNTFVVLAHKLHREKGNDSIMWL